MEQESIASIPMREYESLKQYKEAYEKDKIIFDRGEYSAGEILSKSEAESKAWMYVKESHNNQVSYLRSEIRTLETECKKLKEEQEKKEKAFSEIAAEQGMFHRSKREKLESENSFLNARMRKADTIISVLSYIVLASVVINLFSMLVLK